MSFVGSPPFIYRKNTSNGHEAEQLCREALVSLTAKNPNLKRLVARAHWGIGRAVQRQGRIVEAEHELRKAVAHFAQLQPFNVLSGADAELSLVDNLLAQRRFREAELQLLNTQTILRNGSADSSDEMQRTEELLAKLSTESRHR